MSDGGDILSQSEVESLLSAMSGPDAAGNSPAPPAGGGGAAGGGGGDSAGGFAGGGGGSVASRIAKPREKITPYDFKRPERVGKEQMKALQALHEGFGRNFAAGLSAMLRCMVEVKLTSVDQLTYSEFVFSLENPTCFNLLNADPLEGNLILDINPSILYPMIDRMLGGGREGAVLARRPLTEIELRLVARITSLFLEEMRHAWENVLDLDLEVARVESNPQLVQIVPPNEVVVLISFEVALVDVRGMINLCIPYNSIERIGNKLSANSWVTYAKRDPTPEMVQELTRSLRNSFVELEIRLARTRIAAKDLIGLRIGDIITTDKDMRSPLMVSVQGVPKYFAEPGSYKGRKAVEIDRVIEDMGEVIGE